jgi:trypsin
MSYQTMKHFFILIFSVISILLIPTASCQISAVATNQVVTDREKGTTTWRVRRAQHLQGNNGLFVKINNVTDQIIGGLHAPIGFFTHQVSFVYRRKDGSYAHYCGGSLIAKNIVLGAAHCLLDQYDKINIKLVIQNDLVHLNKYYLPRNNPNMEVHKICEVIIHPKFILRTLHYDFALYKLCEDSALVKNGTIIPIKLNKKRSLPTYHEVLTTTGWGVESLDASSLPDELQMVNINYINNTECTTEPFNYTVGDITDSMMCAGALVGGGRDSCLYDSGGPLIIQGNTKNNHLLVGVVSWGQDCALPEYPGVYSRVSFVIDWILKTGCSWIQDQCDIQIN